MTRAYLWIAVCAGCNSIFGLDDNATFVLPDVQLPSDAPTLKPCFTETFDQLDGGIWEDLAPPEAVGYGFNGGVFSITAMGPVTNTRVGVITKQTFDLVGGAVEITVVNPSTVDAEGGVLIQIDDTAYGLFATRDNVVYTEFLAGVANGSQMPSLSDKQLRIRHDADAASLIWESAPEPGEPYKPLFMPVLVPTPDEVRIAVYGRQRTAGVTDLITLDDLQVTATCP